MNDHDQIDTKLSKIMNTIIKIMAIFFVCLLNFGNTTTYIQEITYEIKKLNCWDKYIVPDNKIAMLSNLEIDHILSVVLNDFILTGYNDKCAKITGNKYTEIHEKNVKKKGTNSLL